MGYKLVEVELSQPLAAITLSALQDGIGLLARWQGRLIGFRMIPLSAGALVSTDQLVGLIDSNFAAAIVAAKLETALPTNDALNIDTLKPTLTIAICTKDRAVRLARLLGALAQLAPEPAFAAVDIVVVDNASVDAATRTAVSQFPNVRYVFEPKAGLNFARNTALATATGDLLAYLDDDVVVDRDWLTGLADAWRSCPNAGGFTGLVLPYRLDTEAQVLFEARGGFGRGFRRLEFRSTRHGNPLYPVGAGMLGAGCNMAFDRRLLIELGGFDEALDTGGPLPGGGDLDMFYRVLRCGRTMVYGPRYAVYHEHRETIAQLRRQYWSWGLGMMAFLVKSWRTDAALRPLHRGMVRWWFLDQFKALARTLRRMSGREARFVLAEMWGGIMGLIGEYDRSQSRIQAIRNTQS